MKESLGQSSSVLIFVYNAKSGLFNSLSDLAHKTFSPDTYQCKLCALTYSAFGMRNDWKQFLQTLGRQVEFLHADELTERYGINSDGCGARLPAVFVKKGEDLKQWISADEINTCLSTECLMNLIRRRLGESETTSL